MMLRAARAVDAIDTADAADDAMMLPLIFQRHTPICHAAITLSRYLFLFSLLLLYYAPSPPRRRQRYAEDAATIFSPHAPYYATLHAECHFDQQLSSLHVNTF